MPRPTTSRLASALRGLAALMALLALLIGVPLLLWRTGVLPDTVPSWHDVATALSSPDNGTLFLGALTLIGWAAWLSFLSSVVVEAGALLRHRQAPRIRVLGATQRLAASLVAGVVLLLPTGAAFAASPTASAVSVSAPALHQAGAAQAAPVTAAASSTQAWSGPTHRVRVGDTLWGLAEHYLGSGTRWHEIADLNRGVRQSDGTVMTGNVLELQPGWTLRLPGTKAPAAPRASEHLVVVKRGDTLSQIAQDELGDGERYPELLEATRHRVQPDGSHLTDPDRLAPGEVIVIPGTTPPATKQAPANPAPDAPAPAQTVPTPPTTATPSSPATPSAQAEVPSPDASTPASQPTHRQSSAATAPEQDTTPSSQPQAAPATHSAPEDSPLSAQQAVAGIAALLGAGLLGVIAWRRHGQQRDRRPGETITMPPETSQVEQVLDRTSSPASVELLDRALRTLAHQHPNAMPVVRAARVASDRVEILAEDPDAEALSPFTDRPGGWWGVRSDRATLLDAEQARQVPAPYPGLATIGTDADGALLLANLPRLGVLLLDGDEQQVREVARGIAMEAGTSVWADHIEVMTVGFGLELQQLLPQCRTMFAPGLPAATADLARVLVEAHQAEKEGGEEPQPWMMVCATAPSPEELYAFADLMGKARGHQIAVVLPATGAREIFPEAEILDTALVTQAQPIEALGTEVVLQRVTDEAYRQLTATMATAVQPAAPAEGAWEHVPDPDRSRFGPSALQKSGPSPRSRLSLLASPAEPGTHKEKTDHEVEAPAPAPAAEPTESAGIEARPLQQQKADTPPTVAAETAADEGPGKASQAGRLHKKERPRVSVVREGAPQPAPGTAAPQVQVLGPLRITGIGEAPIAPKLVLLAACLIFKSERDYGSIANHMDAAKPWSTSTMDQQMSRLRARLGLDSAGKPYLRPKPRGVEQYALSEEVTCDWADFLHLAERGLPHGPLGVLDLEAALALVRGRPFGGGGAHSWAAPIVQTMISRITDTAHAIAVLRTGDDVLDVDAARHAVTVGLDIEPTAEVLYRDWMRIEHRVGNITALRDVVEQVRQMAANWELTLQDETEDLIRRLTTGRGAVKGL